MKASLTRILVVGLLAAFAWPSGIGAVTQGVTGQVMDTSAVPLGSAVMWVEGTSVETLTDSAGQYSLQDLSPGTYRVFAFKPGYAEASQVVSVTNGVMSELDLVLVPRPGTIRRVPEDYSTIQLAVDAAQPGDTVQVGPGTYHENVRVRFKNISLIGAGAENTVIDAGGSSALLVEHQDNPSYVIDGFELRNCSAGVYGEHTSGTFTNLITQCTHVGYWGWYNTPSQGAGPDPQIRNNVFRGSLLGAQIYTSNPYLINNVFEGTTAALFLADDGYGPSFPTVRNNIFLSNQTVLVESDDPVNGPSHAATSYNTLYGNQSIGSYELGPTDIVEAPRFRGALDYRLRYDSPSVDAGDPSPESDDLPAAGMGGQTNDHGIYGGPFAHRRCTSTLPDELADPDTDGLTSLDELQVYHTDGCSLDTDVDGCADSEEPAGAPVPKPGSTGAYDPLNPYDFYDVPAPTSPDMTPNGPRDQIVDIGDVLGVLFYTFADEGGPPNANGVSYDTVKGSCDMDGDTTPDKEGLCYDRSPSAGPNPPWDAGPPNSVIDMGDVLTVLAQAFVVDCTGDP